MSEDREKDMLQESVEYPANGQDCDGALTNLPGKLTKTLQFKGDSFGILLRVLVLITVAQHALHHALELTSELASPGCQTALGSADAAQ